MAGTGDEAQYASDAGALTLVFALSAALMTVSPTLWRLASLPAVRSHDPVVELSLTTPTPEPAAPPAPMPLLHKQIIPRPQPKPVPIVAASTEPVPVESPQTPDEAALIATSSPPHIAPAPQAADHADREAQYAAALRADIDHRTHPPDSAQYRLHRPAGEVRVRFVVTRGGAPISVTLLQSSGSTLLDRSALTIVGSGTYAPMSEEVFVGEGAHAFTVSIEFRPP